jgi:hypothetical protein
MSWQPIDTAPKDGTAVLLCRAIDADGNPIDWRENSLGVFVQVAAWWEGDDDWIVYCSQAREPALHFEPTHWMPLPSPPDTQPKEPLGEIRRQITPCGECHLQPGERCDICGALQSKEQTP